MFQVFQVFHTYVAYVCNGFLVFCKCFSYFGCMLQVFYLDVAKVDLALHMLQLDPPATATFCRCWGAAERRRQVHDKLSTGVGPHAVGRVKNRWCGLHFSCARSNVRR
jgi:hypothetical protein